MSMGIDAEVHWTHIYTSQSIVFVLFWGGVSGPPPSTAVGPFTSFPAVLVLRVLGDMDLKILNLRLQPHLPGANELILVK